MADYLARSRTAGGRDAVVLPSMLRTQVPLLVVAVAVAVSARGDDANDLFAAIQAGNVERVRAICDGDARWATWTDPTGRHPPFQAALARLVAADHAGRMYKRLDVISRYFAQRPGSNVNLLVYGVDDWNSEGGIPPVHVAAAWGTPDLLRDVINRDPSPINDLHMGLTALDYCSFMMMMMKENSVPVMDRLRTNRNLLMFEKAADIWASDLPLTFLFSSSVDVTMMYLHRSSDRKQLLDLRFMVMYQIPVESRKNGLNALLTAVMSGNDDVAMALIDAGADVTASGSVHPLAGRLLVLNAAIYNGLSLSLIRKLVSHPDIRINLPDAQGHTPLDIAIKLAGSSKHASQHYLGIVGLLLDHGANAPDRMQYLEGSNHPPGIADHLLRLLTSRAPVPDYVRASPRPALFEAVEACDLGRVRQICEQFPYWHAWTFDHGRSAFDIVHGNLHAAAEGSDQQRWAELAVYLIEASPHPDPRSLHVVARHGTQDLVKSLASKNPALVNRVDSYGMTPLSWCSWELYWNVRDAHRLRPIRDTLIHDLGAGIDAVSFIVAVDVDVTEAYLAENASGINTAISAAAHKSLVPHLAPAGGPGYTALHMVLLGPSARKEEAALFLVDQGANLSIVDDRGRTPLHLASRVGLDAVVERILSRADVSNLDVNARDGGEMTPLLHDYHGKWVKTPGSNRSRALVTIRRVGVTAAAVASSVIASLVYSNRCNRHESRLDYRHLLWRNGKGVVAVAAAAATVALASNAIGHHTSDVLQSGPGPATSAQSNVNHTHGLASTLLCTVIAALAMAVM